MSLITSTIGQGLLWGVLALGLFLTFRILNFPDMTVEGTFPFGAAICVSALVHGVDPMLATILAFLGGMLTGLVTGLLYTKGKIPVLLAGILTMTGVYSINLLILGKANVGLLNKATLLNGKLLQKLPANFPTIVIGLLAAILIILLLALFLNTDLGQNFIATGDNENMARSLGINTDNMKILGLMISNGLIGLAGGLLAQNGGYADVNMGIGTMVIGLAAIIIGEVAYGDLSLTARLIAVVIGSIIYRLILLLVLQLGFSTNDFKLISAIILAICMMLPLFEKKFHTRKLLKKE
ncbi:branched-chain amino acid ABC transporter permease [Lactobacillus helveticus]|uniref:Branched-chain amino acid ABC transporter permease n=2 Tax=Lactobacillus helveticus TaxID=1587 RepID=A0AAV4E777_LACHE|nr:branched-chain amino acid ABC transporter permease [Lactobacillus helveticus]EGF39017.1 ABC transporter membrane spanning permease [Lactobacillus helveticus MTCC 5463]AGQ22682.1 ABC transporter permease protein [Lactobacillus helveticus CNRZ32]AUJ27072.1 branched-chain amino acid ABC transporter permease [Lactobacillus helveticus]AZA22506.1 MAG: ABC transporter permease [Lactobacillus helveticus]KXN77211.1 branched-chain amino acid ABC transporter permease [Lactobacillus helveticus]